MQDVEQTLPTDHVEVNDYVSKKELVAQGADFQKQNYKLQNTVVELLNKISAAAVALFTMN